MPKNKRSSFVTIMHIGYNPVQLLTQADQLPVLIDLIKCNDTIEVFWFPFNSIISSSLVKDESGTARLKDVDYSALVSGNLVEKSGNVINWDPLNDALWIREVNFVDTTQVPITQE